MGRKRAAKEQDIGAAFSKRSAAAPAASLSLEVSKRRDVVPENLLAAAEANFSKVYKLHDSRAAAAAEQADKPLSSMTTRRASAELEAEEEEDEEEEDAQQGGRGSVINKWEATAASIVAALGRYAGGRYAFPAAAQGWLVHIVLNQHLHDDPLLSVEAARLLQRDLDRHPPAVLADGVLCVYADQMYHPMSSANIHPITQHMAEKRFKALSLLTFHALTRVHKAHDPDWLPASASPRIKQQVAHAHAGHALVWLHLVRLFKRDALPRLQLVRLRQQQQQEQLDAGGEVDEAAAEADTAALQSVMDNCLLLRVLADDTRWAQGTGSKQQLVSDLVEMLAVGLPASNTAQAPPPTASIAAAAAAGDLVAAAAASGACIVAPQQLVAAAQQLLELLLELYSCCEAVGLYSNAAGRSRAAAGRQNDRYHVESVIIDCLMGDLHGEHMLDACKQPQGLRRLLQALPAPHLSRLLSAVVARAVSRRLDDQDTAARSEALKDWMDYLSDLGKSGKQPGFKAGDPLMVLTSILDRWDFARSSIPIGAAPSLFAALTTTSISGILGRSSSSGAGGDPGQQEVVQQLQEAALEVLERLDKGGLVGGSSSAAGDEAVLDVALAKQVAMVGTS